MLVKCCNSECAHKWDYGGKSRVYATCPYCMRKTKIKHGGRKHEKDKRVDSA